jgi:general secretion pathway protein J
VSGRFAHARGFTLLELLVSTFILAVVGALCYGTLSYVSKAREGTAAAFERTRALQLAVSALVTDFEQLEPRPVRDVLGDPQAAVLADRRSQQLVALTRGGWSNTAGLPRATLQRVAYSLEGDVLVRSYSTVLDATQQTAPVRRELLRDVVAVQLRFMDASRTWQEQWPPLVASGATNAPPLRARPVAVEITLELRDLGRVVRLVEVPG